MFMILNQVYIQNDGACSAVLIDICENEAILELDGTAMLKISMETFKAQFSLLRSS